jgi:hypothetical protein
MVRFQCADPLALREEDPQNGTTACAGRSGTFFNNGHISVNEKSSGAEGYVSDRQKRMGDFEGGIASLNHLNNPRTVREIGGGLTA